jgi:hypothetical protein
MPSMRSRERACTSGDSSEMPARTKGRRRGDISCCAWGGMVFTQVATISTSSRRTVGVRSLRTN